MFLNNLKKSARALSTSVKPKCPKPKKNPSKTEPIFRKKSPRLSVKENLGTSKHGVIRCNFNQGNFLGKEYSRVSEAKFYLYHSTKIAKAGPGFDPSV